MPHPSKYAYAKGNPINYIDPYGLFGMDDVWEKVYWATNGWSPSQELVDAAAGFGDGLSGGFTSWVRKKTGIDGVDKCSAMYRTSKTVGVAFGLVVPAGRGAYIYKASQVPKKAKSVEEAVAMRNAWKDYFRGRPLSNWLKGKHQPTLEDLRKRKTDAQIIARSGVTNMRWNIGIIGGGILKAVHSATNDECACDE